MEAVRFGLFAERASQLLAHYEGVAAMKIDHARPDPDLISAKVQATEVIPMLRELLYPKDDDE